MKKFLFLFLAAVPLLFTSCSSDDDDNDVSKIVGLWVETHYWQTESNTWHTWGWVSPYVHEFKSDNTYKRYASPSKYKEGIADKTGTYTFDGTKLSISGGFTRNVTFTESGNGFEWERTSICTRYTP